MNFWGLFNQEAFFYSAIIVGILIGFFCYQILKMTVGASKGWLYMSINGFILIGIGIFGAIFTYADLLSFRAVVMAIGLFGLLFFPTFTYIQLLEDYKLYKPKWFTKKNLVIAIILLFILLFVYNIWFSGVGYQTLMLDYSDISMLLEINSIFYLMVSIFLILTAMGCWYLAKGTGVKMWYVAFAASVLISLGMFTIVYSSGCCFNKLTNDTTVCSSFTDIQETLPLPCFSNLVGFLNNNYLILEIGCIIWCYSYFWVWKKLTRA